MATFPGPVIPQNQQPAIVPYQPSCWRQVSRSDACTHFSHVILSAIQALILVAIVFAAVVLAAQQTGFCPDIANLISIQCAVYTLIVAVPLFLINGSWIVGQIHAHLNFMHRKSDCQHVLDLIDRESMFEFLPKDRNSFFVHVEAADPATPTHPNPRPAVYAVLVQQVDGTREVFPFKNNDDMQDFVIEKKALNYDDANASFERSPDYHQDYIVAQYGQAFVDDLVATLPLPEPGHYTYHDSLKLNLKLSQPNIPRYDRVRVIAVNVGDPKPQLRYPKPICNDRNVDYQQHTEELIRRDYPHHVNQTALEEAKKAGYEEHVKGELPPNSFWLYPITINNDILTLYVVAYPVSRTGIGGKIIPGVKKEHFIDFTAARNYIQGLIASTPGQQWQNAKTLFEESGKYSKNYAHKHYDEAKAANLGKNDLTPNCYSTAELTKEPDGVPIFAFKHATKDAAGNIVTDYSYYNSEEAMDRAIEGLQGINKTKVEEHIKSLSQKTLNVNDINPLQEAIKGAYRNCKEDRVAVLPAFRDVHGQKIYAIVYNSDHKVQVWSSGQDRADALAAGGAFEDYTQVNIWEIPIKDVKSILPEADVKRFEALTASTEQYHLDQFDELKQDRPALDYAVDGPLFTLTYQNRSGHVITSVFLYEKARNIEIEKLQAENYFDEATLKAKVANEMLQCKERLQSQRVAYFSTMVDKIKVYCAVFNKGTGQAPEYTLVASAALGTVLAHVQDRYDRALYAAAGEYKADYASQRIAQEDREAVNTELDKLNDKQYSILSLPCTEKGQKIYALMSCTVTANVKNPSVKYFDSKDARWVYLEANCGTFVPRGDIRASLGIIPSRLLEDKQPLCNVKSLYEILIVNNSVYSYDFTEKMTGVKPYFVFYYLSEAGNLSCTFYDNKPQRDDDINRKINLTGLINALDHKSIKERVAAIQKDVLMEQVVVKVGDYWEEKNIGRAGDPQRDPNIVSAVYYRNANDVFKIALVKDRNTIPGLKTDVKAEYDLLKEKEYPTHLGEYLFSCAADDRWYETITLPNEHTSFKMRTKEGKDVFATFMGNDKKWRYFRTEEARTAATHNLGHAPDRDKKHKDDFTTAWGNTAKDKAGYQLHIHDQDKHAQLITMKPGENEPKSTYFDLTVALEAMPDLFNTSGHAIADADKETFKVLWIQASDKRTGYRVIRYPQSGLAKVISIKPDDAEPSIIYCAITGVDAVLATLGNERVEL